ncbi:unnamed protein product [Musa acuminata subsp. burmannicoides]
MVVVTAFHTCLNGFVKILRDTKRGTTSMLRIEGLEFLALWRENPIDDGDAYEHPDGLRPGHRAGLQKIPSNTDAGRRHDSLLRCLDLLLRRHDALLGRRDTLLHRLLPLLHDLLRFLLDLLYPLPEPEERDFLRPGLGRESGEGCSGGEDEEKKAVPPAAENLPRRRLRGG